MEYRIDERDVKFQLFDWLPLGDVLAADRFADWDRENVEMAIDEAVKIARLEIAPTNEDGDRLGTTLAHGEVRVPESFKPVYETLADNGWIGCSNNPELGGLGLPEAVATVASELFAGANLSLSLVILLTRGTAHLVEEFGTEELRRAICERMYTGRWAGTMCLTEPQAGSDVGASTTRAEKQANGRYLIRGEKIFITYGDHDLTENVIHGVLARTPDAPAGTRGLSLFVVPKRRLGEDGALGEANDVRCSSVEHKLGIHGSPTCSLVFGGEGACEGYLLGEEGDGIRLMFRMMNAARLEVGVQAVATAAAAQQAALQYARERLQMRHWNKQAATADQVAIIEHPDVRRMLLTSSAYVQAMRALLYRTGYYIDMTHVTEGEERERYQSYVDLLTPVCKAWCSDWGFRVTEWSLQVFGGYGYTRDYPAEQYLRDAKITSIYEGTNGIQALDFVGRKLPARGGAAAREMLGGAAGVGKELSGDESLGAAADLLTRAVGEIRSVLTEIPGREDATVLTLLNAVPILDMFGTVLGAGFLLDQARLARDKLGAFLEERGVDSGDAGAVRAFLAKHEEAAFYHDKVQAAVHFAFRALPSVGAQAVAVRAGEKAAMEAVF